MKKYWPEVLVVVIQIALAIVQFFSSIRNSLFSDKDEALRTLLPLQITFLALYVILRGLMNKQAFAEVSGRIDALLDLTSSVKAIHQDEFYRTFPDSIRSARNSVAIAHLDTVPPPRVGKTEPSYYKGLPSEMKKRQDVRFRRVERLSKEKISWLEELIADYKGLKNFSLGCVDLGTVAQKPPQISVQLIDDNLTFLVAVSAHYPHATSRDIVIQDKAVNTIWASYYENTLWIPSLKLIENGLLNEKVWNDIRARFNA